MPPWLGQEAVLAVSCSVLQDLLVGNSILHLQHLMQTHPLRWLQQPGVAACSHCVVDLGRGPRLIYPYLDFGGSVDPQMGLVLDTGELIAGFCSPGYLLENTT